MRYLLDVSALIGLGLLKHEFHERVSSWAVSLLSETQGGLVTCSITELGFVRVLAQVQKYGVSLSEALDLLLQLKRDKSLRFSFLSDDLDISHLPAWVRIPNHTTDGHLVELAERNGLLLATLDAGIPGAFLIPTN